MRNSKATRAFHLRIATAILLATLAAACNNAEKAIPSGQRPKESVPVRVLQVTQEEVPVQLHTIGNGEAYSTIHVKSQVSGEITGVSFAEGGVVQQGQVLFTIDPRPFEVALKEAEANLARAQSQYEQAKAAASRNKAQADNAKVELERDSVLLSRGTISQAEFDQTHTNSSALNAALRADEAGVQSAAEMIRVAKSGVDDAKLQLDYCTIRSPISGKTGSLMLHKGNLVKANDTLFLVAIMQIQPIYVSFAIPETNLSEVKREMASGSLKVDALIPNEEDNPVIGELTFVDNEVDMSTRMIRLKAAFANEDNRLWPGQSVDVVLNVRVRTSAIVAPAQAIQVGQRGPYAYVVKPDMTVELRSVKVGDTHEAKTIIEDGLRPGDSVVTDGQMRITPGASIKILTDAADRETKAQ